MRYGLSVLVAACASGCAGTVGAPTGHEASSAPIPATTVVALDGRPTDLGSVLHGRAALVTLWATWCDACVNEIDALNRLDAQARTRGDAIVVGVAVGETLDAITAFKSRRAVEYAQLVDENFHLADTLGQRHVPTTLVVDHAGRIVYRGGALDGQGLDAFRRVLQENERSAAVR